MRFSYLASIAPTLLFLIDQIVIGPIHTFPRFSFVTLTCSNKKSHGYFDRIYQDFFYGYDPPPSPPLSPSLSYMCTKCIIRNFDAKMRHRRYLAFYSQLRILRISENATLRYNRSETRPAILCIIPF